MSAEEITVSDIGDTFNLVITDVKSLAEEVQGIEDSDKDMQNDHIQQSISSKQNTFVNLIPVFEKHEIKAILNKLKAEFQWVGFNFFNHNFICEVCLWGYDIPEYHEVHILQKHEVWRDIAGKLRTHSLKRYHYIAETEQKLVLELFQCVLPLIKDEIFRRRGLDLIKNKIFSSVNYKVLESGQFLHLMLHNLAVTIEDWHLQSLQKSPYFSALTFMSSEYVIIRWLTSDNEIVEHMFCSHVQNSEKVLPVLAYLQLKGIDMKRLIWYSHVGALSCELPIKSSAKLVNVANRCCPMDALLKWLSCTEALQEILMHVKAAAEISTMKGSYHWISQRFFFIAGREMESYKCLKIPGFLHSILSLGLELDKLKYQCDIEGSSKLDFRKLMSKCKSVSMRIAFLIPSLNRVVDKYDSPTFQKEVETFMHSLLALKVSSTVNKQELFLISVIHMYVSHLVVTNFSQTSNITFTNGLFKKMAEVQECDLEAVFNVIMDGSSGGKGFMQFQTFSKLFTGNNETALNNETPLRLLNSLQQHPEYHRKFPELLKLGQMIMVLPLLNAHSERYTFDITAAEALLNEQVVPDLVPLLSYIYLEGPQSIDHLNKETILKLFVGRKYNT